LHSTHGWCNRRVCDIDHKSTSKRYNKTREARHRTASDFSDQSERPSSDDDYEGACSPFHMLTRRRQRGHQGSRPETRRVSRHNGPRKESRAPVGLRLRERITSRSGAPQAALLCRIVLKRTSRGWSRILRGKKQTDQGRQLTANRKRQPTHNARRCGLWPTIGTTLISPVRRGTIQDASETRQPNGILPLVQGNAQHLESIRPVSTLRGGGWLPRPKLLHLLSIDRSDRSQGSRVGY
jgi:hypothetical protein